MVLVVAVLLLSPALVASDFCVCRSDQPTAVLQKAIDYACGQGADCTAIAQSGACYSPDEVASHCSWAANSYFQKFRSSGATCDFTGAATLSATDPSTSCSPSPVRPRRSHCHSTSLDGFFLTFLRVHVPFQCQCRRHHHGHRDSHDGHRDNHGHRDDDYGHRDNYGGHLQPRDGHRLQQHRVQPDDREHGRHRRGGRLASVDQTGGLHRHPPPLLLGAPLKSVSPLVVVYDSTAVTQASDIPDPLENHSHARALSHVKRLSRIHASLHRSKAAATHSCRPTSGHDLYLEPAL
uniref:Predicted pectin lyase-like family protein with X8 domain n=1 Tax=Triticum dicoccoides TaxID=85692 RepID=B9UN38_TRIDC|nr:predicted pectin lyase-like family protein with X8 domain [Triticum dicoccoides]